MDAYIERNGISVAYGEMIKPGEKVTLRVDNTGFFTVSVVFRVHDASGNLILEQNVTTAVGSGAAWIDFVTPKTEGDYSFQAFGAFADVSQVVDFTVSRAASAPPQGSANLGQEIVNILKWTAVAGIILGAGYVVVKSGLLDAGTSAVRRKLSTSGRLAS